MSAQTKRPLSAIIGTVAALMVAAGLHVSEGDRLTSYRDVVGVWTNCMGNTHGVTPNVTVSGDDCARIDGANMAETAAGADACVPMATLTPGQRAAVVQFAYQEGVQAYCGSVFARKLRQHDPTACDELGVAKDGQGRPKWTTAGDRVWPGIVARRARERKDCLRPAS